MALSADQIRVIQDFVNSAMVTNPNNWVDVVTRRMDEVGVSPAMLQEAYPQLSVAQIQQAYNEARPTGMFAPTVGPVLPAGSVATPAQPSNIVINPAAVTSNIEQPAPATAPTDPGLMNATVQNQPRSSAPTGRIDPDKVDYLTNQLREQYNAINQGAGYEYGGRKSELDGIFRAQAAKLAANGIGDLSDIGESSWTKQSGQEVKNLINKQTGEVIYDVALKPGWETDPTAFEFKQTRNAERQVVNKPIELQKRNGFDRWGFDTSVEGMAHYGINFVDGQAVMLPVWKDTKSDLGPLAAIASIGLSLAVPGSFLTSVGSFLAPSATVATQTALGASALAGVSTGVITGDLDKALIAAATAGGAEYLSASGALGELFDTVGLTEYKDTFGISGGVQTTAQAATEDAIQLAAQGSSATDISNILQQDYGLNPTQSLNIGKNAADVAFAASNAQSLFNTTGSADAVKQALIADGVDVGLAENLATSAAMGGTDASLSSIITDAITSDAGLFSSILSGTEGGFYTATPTDLTNAGITTGGQGINLTQDQLSNIVAGNVPGATFAEQVINAGGTIGAGAAAGGMLDGISDSAKDVVNRLTGGDTNLSGLLTNLAGAGIDYAAIQQLGKEATALGREAEARATAAGAAADKPFTPYTVTAGPGTTTFGVDPITGRPTATVTPSAEYGALRTQALGAAGSTLSAINPAQAAQDLYSRAEALAAPARQRETEQLLSSLGARGLLGVSRNLPTVGGTTTNVNPYLESVLSAQRTAQANTALQAQQFGTQEAQRQAALANALIGTGQGIDTAAMGTLTQGANLGSLATSAEQTSAARQLQATLAGQALRQQYENAGLRAREQGLLGLAGVGRGLLGLPTQPGNTPSANILGNIFTEIFK